MVNKIFFISYLLILLLLITCLASAETSPSQEMSPKRASTPGKEASEATAGSLAAENLSITHHFIKINSQAL
jgi:hypothetical protein